jgi:hypothetical protein
MPQTQQVTPAGPLTLPYRDAPTAGVVASEAALDALKSTRPFALVFAIFLFLCAAASGGAGTLWLVVMLLNRRRPGFPSEQFLALTTPNLVLAPIALVGGVLALRYIAAARRAYNGRSSKDLERALIAQKHVWLWLAAVVIALFTLPLILVSVAVMTGEWP